MWQIFVDALKSVVGWIFDGLSAFGNWAINMILAAIPGDATATGNAASGQLSQFVSAVNAWVPIDYATTLFAAYIAFITTFLVIKAIIKLF